MTALACDLLSVGALGGWDTVKESVLGGVTLVSSTASGTFAETETGVVLLHCGCLSLNPFIEFRIWNNSSSPDVLNVQASISPKYVSKSKTTSHCHLLLHDCTNAAV